MQSSLNNIQGSQGLRLLGLPQVLELCTNTVEAGKQLPAPSHSALAWHGVCLVCRASSF